MCAMGVRRNGKSHTHSTDLKVTDGTHTKYKDVQKSIERWRYNKYKNTLKHFSPVHVILPPWYDAVVDLPSAKHLNGVLDALE